MCDAWSGEGSSGRGHSPTPRRALAPVPRAHIPLGGRTREKSEQECQAGSRPPLQWISVAVPMWALHGWPLHKASHTDSGPCLSQRSHGKDLEEWEGTTPQDYVVTESGEGARVSLTSVGHCEDGVLRDTHSEGHLPELLHEVLPQLRLPPCMGKAEGTMAVTHGQQKFHLGQSCPEDRHPGKKRCPPWMPPALLRPHPTQGSFKDPRHSLALEF